ncbi:hypothetical protein PMIN02_000787 [Paraphaeosphaeria minitans]
MPMPRSAAFSSNNSPSPDSIILDMGTPSFHDTPYIHTLAPDYETSPGELPPYMPCDQSIQHTWPLAHQQQYIADPTSYYNATSCVDAANIVRTMRTSTGYLRARS